MKPKLIHQDAMECSFQAKKALEQGNHSLAFDLYLKAASLESQVATFYFDKPELEPTRSVIIRSAAYLNLKAGQIEEAKKFIFFGLLNTGDATIKEQLNNALELAVSLDNLPSEAASKEYNYINLLRQRSIHYAIQPVHSFGHSVSLEMIKDFSEGYLKSLKAFAVSRFKHLIDFNFEIEEFTKKEIEKLINPLVTNSAYGSFKFSIANDFLPRIGEAKDLSDLKANVISRYHNEIFINPLTDADIDSIKGDFSEEEVDEIFRPLAKIKANNTNYKVAYYDGEDFSKKFVTQILNKQRKKLLTLKSISQEDIGELESSITHNRSSEGGKVHRTIIFKEQLKQYEFDKKTRLIEPKNYPPLMLSDEILLNIVFESETGFTISFEDVGIEFTHIEYEKTIKGFYNLFYERIKYLANKPSKDEDEQRDWNIIKKLIGNAEALKD